MTKTATNLCHEYDMTQQNFIDSPSYSISTALHKGNKEVSKTGSQNTNMQVRAAELTDLDAIESMVRYWAKLGENLPRQRDEIVQSIRSFVVVEEKGKVTGCASLHAYDSHLSEIRSLGVYPGVQGRGQGKALVHHLVEKAQQMNFEKVFVLTRVPEFFLKQNFNLTSRILLPEKIMKDCERCPKQLVCDEVALEICFDH